MESLLGYANSSFGKHAHPDILVAPPFVSHHLLFQHLCSFLKMPVRITKIVELNSFSAGGATPG